MKISVESKFDEGDMVVFKSALHPIAQLASQLPKVYRILAVVVYARSPENEPVSIMYKAEVGTGRYIEEGEIMLADEALKMLEEKGVVGTDGLGWRGKKWQDA